MSSQHHQSTPSGTILNCPTIILLSELWWALQTIYLDQTSHCSTDTYDTYHKNDKDEEQNRNDDVDDVVERLAIEEDGEHNAWIAHSAVIFTDAAFVTSARTNHLPDVYQDPFIEHEI